MRTLTASSASPPSGPIHLYGIAQLRLAQWPMLAVVAPSSSSCSKAASCSAQTAWATLMDSTRTPLVSTRETTREAITKWKIQTRRCGRTHRPWMAGRNASLARTSRVRRGTPCKFSRKDPIRAKRLSRITRASCLGTSNRRARRAPMETSRLLSEQADTQVQVNLE